MGPDGASLWYDVRHEGATLWYLISLIQDLLHGRIQMKSLTNKWYEEVRQGPSGSEDDDDEAELLWAPWRSKVKVRLLAVPSDLWRQPVVKSKKPGLPNLHVHLVDRSTGLPNHLFHTGPSEAGVYHFGQMGEQ